MTDGPSRPAAGPPSPVDRRLLDAVVAVADGLELSPTLERIVRAARDLTGARYAALGVLGPDGLHTEFVHAGMAPEVAAHIGHLPRGLGVLGHITRVGRAVRTDEIAAHPASTGFPDGHPPMHSFLGVPVRIASRVVGNLYLAEAPGGFSDHDEDLVVALAAAAAVAVENAELYRTVTRRGQWLAAAEEVASALLSGVEEDEGLQLIARRAALVADADAAALVLPGIDDDWVLEIAVGDPRLVALVGTVMPEDGRTRHTLRTGRGALVPDLAAEPHLLVPGLRRFGPALYAPLIAREEPVGVLILVRRPGAAGFTDTDLATAQTFAGQAALSLRLAEARRREEGAELVSERARISRDLHDLVVQELFAMGMRLDRLRHRVGQDALADVDASLEALDRTVRQIRATVRDLRTPDGTAGLLDRVRAETDRAGALLGFPPRLLVEDPDGAAGVVPDEVADDVVAVVREALANTARHAGAGAVEVLLALDRHRATVRVTDDGRGLPAGPGRRSGLDNLGERARRHGGDLTAGPGPDGGTRLTWGATWR